MYLALQYQDLLWKICSHKMAPKCVVLRCTCLERTKKCPLCDENADQDVAAIIICITIESTGFRRIVEANSCRSGQSGGDHDHEFVLVDFFELVPLSFFAATFFIEVGASAHVPLTH